MEACPSCDALVRPGVAFCTSCGAKLGVRRRWAPALIVLAAAVAAAGGFYFFAYAPAQPKVTCKSGRCPAVGRDGARIAVSGTGTSLDRVRLDVPADALERRVKLSVSEGQPLAAGALGEGRIAAGPSVRFEPDGQEFDEPVGVRMPFTPPSGTKSSDVRVVVASSNGKSETIRPTEVDVAGGLVHFELLHFSTAVAVVPGAPPAVATAAQAGDCEPACTLGQTCENGTCKCPHPGDVLCAKGCTNPATDNHACGCSEGGTGVVCAAGQECCRGVCITCTPGMSLDPQTCQLGQFGIKCGERRSSPPSTPPSSPPPPSDPGPKSCTHRPDKPCGCGSCNCQFTCIDCCNHDRLGCESFPGTRDENCNNKYGRLAGVERGGPRGFFECLAMCGGD